MDLRPLYLLGNQRLELEPGPALAIHRAGQSTQYLPLRWISRVILGPRVHWPAEMLPALLHAGIPIAILGPRQPLGLIVPASQRGLAAGTLLAEHAHRPDYTERYTNWRQASERTAILRAARSRGLRLTDLRPSPAWRRLTWATLAPRHADPRPAEQRKTDLRPQIALLRSIADSLAGRVIADSGLDSLGLHDSQHAIDPGRDLGRILRWDALRQLMRPDLPRPINQRDLTRTLEGAADSLAELGHRQIGRLTGILSRSFAHLDL